MNIFLVYLSMKNCKNSYRLLKANRCFCIFSMFFLIISPYSVKSVLFEFFFFYFIHLMLSYGSMLSWYFFFAYNIFSFLLYLWFYRLFSLSIFLCFLFNHYAITDSDRRLSFATDVTNKAYNSIFTMWQCEID